MWRENAAQVWEDEKGVDAAVLASAQHTSTFASIPGLSVASRWQKTKRQKCTKRQEGQKIQERLRISNFARIWMDLFFGGKLVDGWNELGGKELTIQLNISPKMIFSQNITIFHKYLILFMASGRERRRRRGSQRWWATPLKCTVTSIGSNIRWNLQKLKEIKKFKESKSTNKKAKEKSGSITNPPQFKYEPVIFLLQTYNFRGKKHLQKEQSLRHIGSAASRIIIIINVSIIIIIIKIIFNRKIYRIRTKILIILIMKVPWKPLGVRLPICQQWYEANNRHSKVNIINGDSPLSPLSSSS